MQFLINQIPEAFNYDVNMADISHDADNNYNGGHLCNVDCLNAMV